MMMMMMLCVSHMLRSSKCVVDVVAVAVVVAVRVPCAIACHSSFIVHCPGNNNNNHNNRWMSRVVDFEYRSDRVFVRGFNGHRTTYEHIIRQLIHHLITSHQSVNQSIDREQVEEKITRMRDLTTLKTLFYSSILIVSPALEIISDFSA